MYQSHYASISLPYLILTNFPIPWFLLRDEKTAKGCVNSQSPTSKKWLNSILIPESVFLIAKMLSFIKNWLSQQPPPHQIREIVWQFDGSNTFVASHYLFQEIATRRKTKQNKAPLPLTLSNPSFEMSPSYLLVPLQPVKDCHRYLNTNSRQKFKNVPKAPILIEHWVRDSVLHRFTLWI